MFLSGDRMQEMREGVESFVITIVSYEGMALRMNYSFEEDNKARLIIF
jgi:hypothetical protein